MFDKCNRDRVRGFLRAQGTAVVNGSGQEVLLTGWGLGNWLVPEGYMWLAGESARFDRPRRIEQVICELTSAKYAKTFWAQFQERYVTEYDIRTMAQQGYNSVRVPIHWRALMEERPGIHWVEDGFRLLDRLIDWCEQYGLYVFLDLHAAPGGQTGANIDDSADDQPRLFLDRDAWEKAIRLWEALARRYKDRWIVGGYDLLNEPIKPGLTQGKALNAYLPRLVAFYEQCIAAIRAIDPVHMISLEGDHWATDMRIFFKRYDDNMILHFHRYACMPGREAFAPYIEVSRRLGVPLWLGETGENTPEWFAAMFPMSIALNIGYNLWPWKKMDCRNSPFSIVPPEGWPELIAYANGGERPSRKRSMAIFNQFLDNLQSERCQQNPDLTNAVFRSPGFVLRGTDFDELPGRGSSFSGSLPCGNLYYRSNTNMDIVLLPDADDALRFPFDSGWDRLALRLTDNEFAKYYINSASADFSVSLFLLVQTDTEMRLSWAGRVTALSLAAREPMRQYRLPCSKGAGSLLIQVVSGTVLLASMSVQV